MGIKFPNPWKTLMIKFPPPRDGKGVKCPGYVRGGHVEASFGPIHKLCMIVAVKLYVGQSMLFSKISDARVSMEY